MDASMMSVRSRGQDASKATTSVGGGSVGMGVLGICVGVGDGAGVGVSGKIRLVAARQAKVEKRSVIVAMMSFSRGINKILFRRDDDPACVQKIKIQITEQHQDPKGELETVEKIFP